MTKRKRSIQPDLESLNQRALLSTSVLHHLAVHVAVSAHLTATTSTDIRPLGGVGRGHVSPLGLLEGRYNLVQQALTIRNGRGSLKLQLSRERNNSHLVRLCEWQIIEGTGNDATWNGSGPGAFTLIDVA